MADLPYFEESEEMDHTCAAVQKSHPQRVQKGDL